MLVEEEREREGQSASVSCARPSTRPLVRLLAPATSRALTRDRSLSRSRRSLSLRYGTVSCGPASDALAEQLAAKAARYTADWGPGAFVLKYGFCEALGAKLRELMGPEAAGLVSLLSADSLPLVRARGADDSPGGLHSAAPGDVGVGGLAT